MSKPKIALYWCSSCGGCEESVIDLAADILDIVSKVDIVFWPIALDYKYSDLEALADNELAVSLINGAIRMDEQEQIAKLLRRKSQLVIAHGACAHLGGVVGLANLYNSGEVLNRAYQEVPSVKNPQGILPGGKIKDEEIKLARFYNTVKALDQVIAVDYYIPGCPPTPELIKNALVAVLENKLPPKGSVLAEKKALCDSCSRRDSKPEKIKLKKFQRLHQAQWDQEKCFLAEGLICLGPATRGGCKERCIKANMPCRGCFGPLDEVLDQGAKSLSFLASMLEGSDEKMFKKVIDSIPDTVGLFYRYSLAASILRGKLKKG